MGKAEFMTPKAIANRMKSKGLQKLRWFCQLCNKQCRDENGFKCHANSEGHKRQLGLFASRPGKFLDTYSHEFEKTFLDELKRRFGSKRVHANLVYNEYIRDKNHVHMNATVWTTLSGFVRHLGKSGKCTIDETPKGWYMAYINRDPEVLARQEALKKKERMDVDDEDRNRQVIEKRLLELAKMGMEPGEDTEVDPEDEPQFDPEKPHEAITFTFARPGIKSEPATPSISTPSSSTTTSTSSSSSPEDPSSINNNNNNNNNNNSLSVKMEPEENGDGVATRDSQVPPPVLLPVNSNSNSNHHHNNNNNNSSSSSSSIGFKISKPVNAFELAAKSAKENKEKDGRDEKDSNKRKKSAMEELREAEERDREKRNRRDYWLANGIIVKIMNKTLAGGKYYKEKGVVQDVIDKYVGQIKVLELNDVLKLDQDQLETVIPQIGGKLKVVNGAWRGETAILQALDVDNFSAKIKLTSGSSSGKILDRVPYEDICKSAAQ